MMDRRRIATLAAVAWIATPVMWVISTMLDRTMDWEGSPVVFYQLGAMLLLGAGALSLATIVDATGERMRRVSSWAALVLFGLAVVSSLIAWAIPLWTAAYGIAALFVALAHQTLRGPLFVMAGGMALGLGAQVVLTAMEVGRPDSYGDYPVAWTTAYVIAVTGAAIAMWMLARRQPRDARELTSA